MSHATNRWKAGEVLRITKLVNDHGVEMSDDAWAVVLDDEDMMVFTHFKSAANHVPGYERGWCSQVRPLGWADEDTQIAVADEVPADIPPDFWPLSARLSLK